MNIKELKINMPVSRIEVTITEKGRPRTISDGYRGGKQSRLCTTTASDESGTIELTLWNEEIDQVNVGDKIRIINGFVADRDYEKVLSSGKGGHIEKINE